MKKRNLVLIFSLIISLLIAFFSFIVVFARINQLSVVDSKENKSSKIHTILSSSDPIYAQSDIIIDPYPVLAGQPVEACVVLHNTSLLSRDVVVQFSWANFGIGSTFTNINGRYSVHLPPDSTIKQCTHWVPTISGNITVQTMIEEQGNEPLSIQRNTDVSDMFHPGVPNSMIFAVRNPLQVPADVTLELVPYLSGWIIDLSQDVLPDMNPNETRYVALTVTPPASTPLPPDNTPIVDVEAIVNSELIGGFRKVFRPPVPIHNLKNPVYAESEITIDPYPVQVGQLTEVCVKLHNPTPLSQDVEVQFSWASFGIGLPFTPINEPYSVQLPPYSTSYQCTHWVPPISGHICVQVTLEDQGYEPQSSQRNIDVSGTLQPGIPDVLTFPVGNPLDVPITVILKLSPYLTDWTYQLSQDVIQDLNPGEIHQVILIVIPPSGQPLPSDNTPIVDVEAYVDDELIGGFRKVFRPPVPLHNLKGPVYAESGITINPYPALVGQPTDVCVKLRNPTPLSQEAEVQFSWAGFGIGLPFTPINEPYSVQMLPYSVSYQCAEWIPPFSGHLCLQVMLAEEGYELQSSQRNVAVTGTLQPGVPDLLSFQVGNPFQQPITVTLGLIPYLPEWSFQLSQDVLPGIGPGETRQILLTVTPPDDKPLPSDNTPIVDVEAYAKGELISGLELYLKVDRAIFLPFIKK